MTTREWKQPDKSLHRWVYTDGRAIYATVWNEAEFWMWSVNGDIPQRGADRLFRSAIRAATEAVA